MKGSALCWKFHVVRGNIVPFKMAHLLEVRYARNRR